MLMTFNYSRSSSQHYYSRFLCVFGTKPTSFQVTTHFFLCFWYRSNIFFKLLLTFSCVLVPNQHLFRVTTHIFCVFLVPNQHLFQVTTHFFLCFWFGSGVTIEDGCVAARGARLWRHAAPAPTATEYPRPRPVVRPDPAVRRLVGRHGGGIIYTVTRGVGF